MTNVNFPNGITTTTPYYYWPTPPTSSGELALARVVVKAVQELKAHWEGMAIADGNPYGRAVFELLTDLDSRIAEGVLGGST